MQAVRIDLVVAPGAPRSEIVGRYGAAWKIRVSAPPERGRANAALLELLARTLGVDVAAVALVSGAGARRKRVSVDGLTAEQVEERLIRAV